ncbi:MAG: amidohydrolase family protein [Paludibacteraceae bacterium]|nr:amidohydrolase family protein [Paludibacteraceae bacterium]
MLYRANILFTPTPEAFSVLERGYIAVAEDGTIEGVFETLPAQYAGAEVRDFGDALLIPAMNDLHVHAPQYRNMGIAMDMELLPWLNTYTFPEEERYADLAYADYMYRRFVHDLWLQGTMRAAVFATIHADATCLLADLFAEAGMGAYIGLVGMDRNCPESLANSPETAIRDIERLAAHVKGYERVKPIVTPRFVPACTPVMLQALGDFAATHHLPVQSHLSENRAEIRWVRELEPEASCYGDAYCRYGLFGQTPTLMAHCCYTEGEELRLMRENGVYAVHCPTSNCNLGSGIAPVRRFMQEGVPVALGSDISGGHHLSLFRVMHYAVEMSKLRYAQTQGEEHFLKLSEAFYLATKGGGSFFGKVGAFEKGYAFDALVIDDAKGLYKSPMKGDVDIPPYDLKQRLERFVYLGDDRHITHRFCQGKEIEINI